MSQTSKTTIGKITIIGAGNIGFAAQNLLAMGDSGTQIVLQNRNFPKNYTPVTEDMHPDVADAAKKQNERLCFKETNQSLVGARLRFRDKGPDIDFTDDLDASLKDSDIVIITAGAIRGPNDPRDILLTKNRPIIKKIAERARELAPNATYIIVSNPVDVMTHNFLEYSQLRGDQVMGIGSDLDSSRFASIIHKHVNLHFPSLGVKIEDISKADVIGEHGDTMVPLTGPVRIQTVEGELTLHDLFQNTPKVITEIVQETRETGKRINAHTGHSDVWGPATLLAETVRKIDLARKGNKVEPLVASLRSGDFSNACIGRFVSLTAKGRFEPVPLILNHLDADAFKHSVEKVNSQSRTTPQALHSSA